MKLNVEPCDNDAAKVSTENVDMVCDDARVTSDGNLKLSYAAMTLNEVHLDDEEVAWNAKEAIRRAIVYDESWGVEDGVEL